MKLSEERKEYKKGNIVEIKTYSELPKKYKKNKELIEKVNFLDAFLGTYIEILETRYCEYNKQIIYKIYRDKELSVWCFSDIFKRLVRVQLVLYRIGSLGSNVNVMKSKRRNFK